MPGLDGAELSRLLRERHGDDIVLLAMTGRELDARAKETFGRVDHDLMKPVEPRELRKVLPPQD